ncbi:hypothetical protein MPSEU_000648600 [Mayamaea pseudoterrestris]|nr:hypothetical protein MPSEU_000648600 [Mayamaea pseudoterrestris]
MTVLQHPHPIRPRPGHYQQYHPAMAYHHGFVVPCCYQSHQYAVYSPEANSKNVLRQRLNRKMDFHRRPGSSFAPPPTATSSSSKSMARRHLPMHASMQQQDEHYYNEHGPITLLHETESDEIPCLLPVVSIVEDDASVVSQDDDASMQQQQGRTYKVSFDPQVKVYEIPHRDSYEQKSMIWNSQREIKRQASRNTIEYAYEQFDWRMAAEEAQFVQLPTGQFVHPAHFMSKEKHAWLREQYRNRQQEHKWKQRMLRHGLAMEA